MIEALTDREIWIIRAGELAMERHVRWRAWLNRRSDLETGEDRSNVVLGFLAGWRESTPAAFGYLEEYWGVERSGKLSVPRAAVVSCDNTAAYEQARSLVDEVVAYLTGQLQTISLAVALDRFWLYSQVQPIASALVQVVRADEAGIEAGIAIDEFPMARVASKRLRRRREKFFGTGYGWPDRPLAQ